MLMALLAAGSLGAQPGVPENSARTDLGKPQQREVLIETNPNRPNVVAGHKVVYSGVLVQVVKTKNPAQLVNPFAPMDYGREGNLDRDVMTGKPTGGFKIFSLSF
jgi:hypothetical protein